MVRPHYDTLLHHNTIHSQLWDLGTPGTDWNPWHGKSGLARIETFLRLNCPFYTWQREQVLLHLNLDK